MLLKINLKYWWKLLFLIASTGIILIWVGTFALHNVHRTLWKEELMTSLYFTYISNMLAVVLGFFKGFTTWGKKIEVKVIEIFAAVNLALTFLVYWTLLFPSNQPKQPIGWASDMIVHLTTPLLTIGLFLWSNYQKKEQHHFNAFKNTSWHFVFLFGYFAMALILYFALGAHHEDAIYNFLDFVHNPWYISVLVALGIVLVYFGLTFGAYQFVNKFAQKK